MSFFKYIFLILVCISFCFCDVDLDVVLDQEEDIEYYLDYYDIDYDDLKGVYRQVANSDRADYDQCKVINSGDSVSFYFEAYTFSKYYGAYEFFFSNKAYIVEALEEDYGLSSGSWSTDAIEAVLGKTDLLKGVTLGLEGCRQGDSVLLYMTSDYAYEDKQVGNIDPYTPIVYIATIQ